MSEVTVFIKKVFYNRDLSGFDDLEQAKDYYEFLHREMEADEEVVFHVEVGDE